MLVPQSQPNEIIKSDRLSVIFDRYLQTDVGEGDAATDTLKTYRTNLKQFLVWCSQMNLHPLAATRRQLKEYRLWLIEQCQYQRATVALKLSVVRRFYDALIENELTSFNPALGLKPPRENRDPAERINYLQSEEMYQLLESMPKDNTVASLRDRLLIAVMIIQGVRTIEMHRVSVGDIVKRGKDVGLKVTGKRSVRIVPLTPDLAKLLRQYLTARKKAKENLTAETPLFVSYSRNCDSSRLSRRSMQRTVDKYLIANGLKPSPVRARRQKQTSTEKSEENCGGKAANRAESRCSNLAIEPAICGKSEALVAEPSPLLSGRRNKPLSPQRHLSAHSLRHTAGTLALRAGASLRQVQDLLGHADPRTTALYAHIADRWQANPALWLTVPAL
jgi:site-specific recombinase XerD